MSNGFLYGESSKDDIKSRVDLRDYVRFYNHGTDEWKAATHYIYGPRCPECNKPKRYAIYQDGFYCHHCHFSGDVFEYVMRDLSCSFNEALNHLKNHIGYIDTPPIFKQHTDHPSLAREEYLDRKNQTFN